MNVLNALAVLSLMLPAACASPPPGSAACVPRQLASLPVQIRGHHPTIDVSLDGHPMVMVLDLGAQTSVLADTVADRLDLSRDPSALPMVGGVGGNAGSRWAATVRRLTLGGPMPGGSKLGGLTLDDKRMEVAQMQRGSGGQQFDGLIGLDVLLKYDIDWDLPHSRVTFNAASGCDGPPVGWAPSTVKVELHHPTTWAAYGTASKLLLLPVLVDDRPVTALLDSGAAVSLIDAATAASLEPPGQAGDRAIRMAGIGPDSPAGTVHRFRSLTVAGETITGPVMVVAPVPAAFGDMILGVGFMARHRSWMPAGGGRIWFAPPSPPTAIAAVAAPAAAAATTGP